MKNDFPFLRSLPILSLLLVAGAAHGALTAQRLRCESLENPLGIDATAPRLSWALAASGRNQRQSAYRILVASSAAALARDQGDLWDSGKVASDETLNVAYTGKPLRSGQGAFWKVRSWDGGGVPSAWSRPATFEIGLLRPEDWGGKWIGLSTDVNAKPAPLLRRAFSLGSPIRRARAYVCGLGYYELRLNGKKVGDRVLDPGYTQFDRRTLYATYDVTNALRKGGNAIGVTLGNGWYNVQPQATWNFHRAPWRAAPKLLLRLEIETTDGRTRTIVSDGGWRAATGPITENSLYVGETYDARLEKAGWDRWGYDDRAWGSAIELPAPKAAMAAQAMPPIRVVKRLKPVRITEPRPGVFVVDFGQNFAGFPRLRVSGLAGTTVSMRCGERLAKDGTVDQADIEKYMTKTTPRQAFQTNRYTLKGGGTETYEPRFTYQGFQYVEVTGAPGKLGPENLEGLVVHTDVARVGEFACSNPLLEKILDSARWAYLSNLESVFTDCPHREKNGWTGDAQLASEGGLLGYDSATVYRKWLDDVADAQKPGPNLALIVPTPGWGKDEGSFAPAWDVAYIEIPWNVYLYTGDKSLLQKHFDGFATYLDWLATRSKDLVIKGILGDWCPWKTETPVELTSTAYLFHDAVLASKAATVLGRSAEARKYADLAERVRKAFNARFFDPKTGLYGNGSQTAQSAALYFDLAEPSDRPAVLKVLLDNVARCDDHIDAGILGSKYLLNVLTQEGRTDVAYRIAGQRTLPSWGWWIEQGATTMWEQWNGTDSRNHIMFGEIAAWFYKALAGINPDPAAPGFKHVLIAPHPAGDLTYARASHESAYGLVRSGWTRANGVFRLEVTIPANTTATVTLPALRTATVSQNGKTIVPNDRTDDHATVEIGSGRSTFVVRSASGR